MPFTPRVRTGSYSDTWFQTIKCSLLMWFLSLAFLLVFVMSLLFSSHHSMATLPYLDLGTWGAPTG